MNDLFKHHFFASWQIVYNSSATLYPEQ